MKKLQDTAAHIIFRSTKRPKVQQALAWKFYIYSPPEISIIIMN